MIITSFANQKVKFIRKLEQKKYRQESGVFFVEGLHTVGEAVQIGTSIVSLVIAPELLVSEFGQSLLKHPNIEGVDRIEVSQEIYEKIAHKEGPQGIGAIVQQDWRSLDDMRINDDSLWVALDAVSDPGNLGTIMRTAEAVGAEGIILLGNSTDPHDPTAVKATMGALFSLTLTQSNWTEFIEWKRTNGISMVGTSEHA
jgi:TrmH family RNA methyltransferase